MNFRLNIIFSFLLILCTIEGFPQSNKSKPLQFSKGYIIQNNGDSVSGFIAALPDSYALLKSIFFKSDRYFEKQTFTPLDIAYFGNVLNSSRYISLEVPTLKGIELYFVKYLLDGEYDVCYYKFLGKEHVLIRDPMNRVIDVTNPPDLYTGTDQSGALSKDRFDQILRDVFVEKPEILGNLEKLKPNKQSIINLLTDYYDHNNKPYKVYGIRQISVSAGITTGLSANLLSVKVDNVNVKSVNSFSPSIGVNAQIVGKNSGVGLILENSFALKSFHYNYDTDYTLTKEFNEVFIKSLVNVSRIGLHWSAPARSKLRPFAEGGGVLTGFIAPDYDNYKDILRKSDNMVLSYLNHDETNTSLSYGGFIRAGVYMKLKENRGLKISGGYSIEKWSNSEKISSIDVALSYMFRIQ